MPLPDDLADADHLTAADADDTALVVADDAREPGAPEAPGAAAYPTLALILNHGPAVVLRALLRTCVGAPPELSWIANALDEWVPRVVEPEVIAAFERRADLPPRVDLRSRTFYSRYAFDPVASRWRPHPDAARLNGLPPNDDAADAADADDAPGTDR